MKKLALICIGFSLFQCGSENSIDNEPDNFLDKDKFTQLIYDINLLEGNLLNFNLNRDVMKDSAMKLYKGVFKTYDIDYDDFKDNQDYYILTDQYKEISQEVLDRITKEHIKYTDVEPVQIMSLIQFKQLFEGDNLMGYMEKDTTGTYQERLDSIVQFYRNDPEKLNVVEMDSVSFEVNIAKLRKGSDLFRMSPTLKKMFKKDE